MRVHRIYVPQLSEQIDAQQIDAQQVDAGHVDVQIDASSTTITLRGREAHHLVNVLRVQTGQAVRAFDGKGLEADGVVLTVGGGLGASVGDGVVLELSAPQASDIESNWHIHMAVGLLKGDKLADVVRQVTELGAVSVQPFSSRFGDVPKASPNKLSRWRRIAQEAAKQSGRSVVPQVHDPVKIGTLEPHDLGIIAHPYASDHLTDVLTRHDLPEKATLTLVTGAEGGLADQEIDHLIRKGFQVVSLGKRILRAETAPMALLSALLLPAGR